MLHRTSRHRRYSDTCGGELTVYVTPTDDIDQNGRNAFRIGVVHGDRTWEPSEPLWQHSRDGADSVSGRREAADSAVGFFEHFGCGAELNPAHGHGKPLRATRNGPELIDNLRGELWAPAPRAAKKLYDAYRVGRPRSQEEFIAFAQAFIDELNKHAPDGTYFGTPTGDEAELGWYPIEP